MRMIRSGWIKVALFLAAVAGAWPALGQHPTAAEYRALPPYCHARVDGSPEERSTWSQTLGPDVFLHVHHYCFGLHFMRKAQTTMDKGQRKYLYSQAIGEFGYVIKNWPPGTAMTQKAKAYVRQAELMQKMQ